MLRTGLYTEYQGHQLALQEVRQEVPQIDPEYYMSAPRELSKLLPDFKLSAGGANIYKTIRVSEISNAFWIDTFGKYKGQEVKVFEGRSPDTLRIASSEPTLAEKLGLIKVNDNWYIQDVARNEVSSMIERVRMSHLNKPLPSSLLPDNF